MNDTHVPSGVLENCARLEKLKNFDNLYNIICSHAGRPAAFWLENDEVKSADFTSLAEMADNWASALSSIFGTEGRVAISLDSCKEWFPLFWGLVRSGHDILLLDVSATDEKTEAIMNECGCSRIVCGRKRSLPESIEQVCIDRLKDSPSVNGYVPVWGHDIALCTSGTASDSKIFVYDEETICEIALFSKKVYMSNRLLIDDYGFRTLAFLPFHHVLGFAGIFIWSHFLGYTTVYLKDRTPQTIVKTATKCRISQLVTVPVVANNLTRSFYAKLAKANPTQRAMMNSMLSASSAIQRIWPEKGHALAAKMFKGIRAQLLGNDIKSIVIGGSHTDPTSLKFLTAIGYYTICGFGMTEASITSFNTLWDYDSRINGSIGQPMSNTEYKIAGDDNVGELLIRGKGLHDGRFVDGKLSEAAIDAEGWLHTGDLARKDKDFYYIEGRIKDVIIGESGENVYPDELEDRFSNLDGVKQFSILGLPDGKSKYEKTVLVLNLGERIYEKALLEKIAGEIKAINTKLAAFSRINAVYITSTELPVANRFKVRRQYLKQRLMEGGQDFIKLDLNSATVVPEASKALNGGASQLDASQTKEYMDTIIRIFSELMNVPADKITPDSHFIDDLGGDSLQLLSVAMKIEEKYSVIIPDSDYPYCATPRSASEMLSRIIHGHGNTTVLKERTPVTDFSESSEYKEFRERRENLLASGSDPYFVNHESPLRDTCIVDGRTLIDFGNYNYAGMSGRKEVSAAAKKAIDKYGTSASGSRLLAGEKPVHGELERAIAEWKHSESAVVCVGGHSTNVTFVGNFCGPRDLILYDALAHNSVTQGCRLSEAVAKSFPHNDTKALATILKAQRKYFEKVLIVIEGVYSMDGDIADVPSFVAIKKEYGCFLMVDEAHSACVLGPTGGGVDEYFHLEPDDIDIKMGTLSKGLGTCGGYLAGKKEIIEYLKYNMPGFVFSVGMSPALAAASLEAIRLLKSDASIMERLHRNIAIFAYEARKRGLNICAGGKSAILPVLVGNDADAFALSIEMNRRGISVPPAVYPAVPKDKARLRFNVTSEHKREQIVCALDTLTAAAKDLGISLPAGPVPDGDEELPPVEILAEDTTKDDAVIETPDVIVGTPAVESPTDSVPKKKSAKKVSTPKPVKTPDPELW